MVDSYLNTDATGLIVSIVLGEAPCHPAKFRFGCAAATMALHETELTIINMI